MKFKQHIWFILLFIAGCGSVPETENVSSTAPSIPPTEAPLLSETNPLSWDYSTVTLGSTTIEYATLLPPDFDPAKSYPLLLALPPGGQTKRMVDAGLETFWQRGALYGFIIVSPVKPAESNYMSEASLLLPDFVAYLENQLNIDGKPHLGGVSNGGISTFKAGLERPDLYQSLTVLPGYARSGTDVFMLSDLKITLYVGADDGAWVTNSQRTHDRLIDAGHTDVVLEIFENEGHLIESLTANGAGKIFERLLE